MPDSPASLFRPVSARFRLRCALSEVRPVALAVTAFLAEQQVPEGTIQQCELALVEACNNAVTHACPERREELIQVDALCDGQMVELRVRDHSAGFDLPDCVELPDPEEEGGRGLFLIQTLMDRVEYLRGRAGNCLVLEKQLIEPLAKPSELRTLSPRLEQQLLESEQIISDMAEELSFCYESLSAIFRSSAELGRTHDLEEFSQRLLTDLAQITSADWFVLRLTLQKSDELQVFTTSATGLALPPLRLLPGAQVPAGAELESASTREDVWFDSHRPIQEGDPLAQVQQNSIGLIHPICRGESLIGTLAVGKSATQPQFTAVHANVIHTFADFLAIQIVNARFQEEQVASRLVSREIEIARNIQRSLLPKSLPEISGYRLAGYCESAQLVGGDFYDVLKVSDQALLLIIADVMGKGVPAAMFAAILRSLLRAHPEWTDQPATLLSRVNRLLFEELSGVDMFITAQVVYVDLAEQRIVTANAGHCPLLFAAGDGTPVRMLAPEGLPLGILRDTNFTSETQPMPPRSRVLLYTDGVTEARNGGGEFFGQDRLLKWLKKNAGSDRNAEELRDDLARQLDGFRSARSASDDQTFLIMG